MTDFSKYLKITLLASICSLTCPSFAAGNNAKTPQNQNNTQQTPTTTTKTSNHDPLEPYNRVAFQFNRGFNDYFMTPIAKGYNFVLPNFAKKGISNFFTNLNSVNVIANDFLQFKLYQGWSDIWRLAVNTSVGIGGLFDVATHMGLERHREEFGLTLAYWGWENSSYFVIPIIGPSTVRDTVGLGGDYFMSVYPYIHSTALSDGLLALFFVSYRAEIVDLQEIEEQAAFDRYEFEKNAYLQNRAYRIEQNKGQAAVDYYVPDEEDEATHAKNKKVEKTPKKTAPIFTNKQTQKPTQQQS